jgi:hypothetical protein
MLRNFARRRLKQPRAAQSPWRSHGRDTIHIVMKTMGIQSFHNNEAVNMNAAAQANKTQAGFFGRLVQTADKAIANFFGLEQAKEANRNVGVALAKA